MTRIDRYLLFLYLRVLVICFASICGLIIVVHLFSNLDEFIRYAKVQSRPIFSVLVQYYGPYSLTIFEKLSGMLALLAFLFTIAWLDKTREMTALLAAGIPKRRILRSLLFASAGIILCAIAVRELAIPRYQDQLIQNPQDLAGSPNRNVQPTFDARAIVLIKGHKLLPREHRIIKPELRVQGGPIFEAMGNILTADSGVFHSAQQDRPAGYLLENVTQPTTIDHLPSIYSKKDGGPLLLTSLDTAWVAAGSCFFASEVEYPLLRGDQGWKNYASTAELIVHLRERNTPGGDDLRVTIHQRLLRGFIDWTVLLLGLPVLLARPDRNMFWAAGTCLLIVATFTGVIIAFEAMSASQIVSPLLAVWVPLTLFLPWSWAKTQAAMET